MPLMTRFGLLFVVIFSLAGPAVPLARADDDHEQARQALQRGEIRPLSEILDKVRKEIPCEIIEVEFEREGEKWIYELKAIDPTGRFLKIHVDAASNTILWTKRKHENPDR